MNKFADETFAAEKAKEDEEMGINPEAGLTIGGAPQGSLTLGQQ